MTPPTLPGAAGAVTVTPGRPTSPDLRFRDVAIGPIAAR